MKEGSIAPDRKAEYPFSSMRDYLAWLEENDLMLTIEDEVSNKYETTAIGREMFVKGGSGYGPTPKALLFTNIKGHPDAKTCTMLTGHIDFISKILGTTKENLYKVYLERVDKLKEMKVVSNGKFAENKYEGDEVDVEKTIPVEVSAEKQGGPYLTMWPSTFLDPEMGSYGLGIYRHMVQGKNASSILLLPGQRRQEA
jgi:UbiD family decarboxylase